MAFDDVKMDPSLTAHEWFNHCRCEVWEQMRWALTLHGMPTTDPVRGSLTLAEECGEVAAAALNATRPSGVMVADRVKHLKHMIAELNQVAGYAMLLRCSMEGEIRRLSGEQQ